MGGESSRGVGDELETWLRGSLGGNTQETGVWLPHGGLQYYLQSPKENSKKGDAVGIIGQLSYDYTQYLITFPLNLIFSPP